MNTFRPWIPSLRFERVAEELIQKVKGVATTVPRRLLSIPGPLMAAEPLEAAGTVEKVVAIGISTGGPQALSYLLPQLPADLPAALLIVQHMPEGFTELLARRLHQLSKIEVKEAKDGDLILPGRALIAPGNRHMKVTRLQLGAITSITGGPEVNGHRPSVDVLFSSVAEEYGPNAIGILMTGTGEDGAEGLGRILAAGGATLAQDEESSVIFGMPKAAIELGHVQKVVPLAALPRSLAEFVRNHSPQPAAPKPSRPALGSQAPLPAFPPPHPSATLKALPMVPGRKL